MTNDTEAKYIVAVVEAVILEIAAELDPEHLPARELALRIVSNAEDAREVEIATRAIQRLREFGLFADRNDDIVEPTPAGLHAVALLA